MKKVLFLFGVEEGNSLLRNGAEGEFPARVSRLQPEPKARDA